MIRYTIAMSIRFVCIALVFIVPGWWRLLPAIGAVILPYIAVVLANTAAHGSTTPVVSTGALLPAPRDSASN